MTGLDTLNAEGLDLQALSIGSMAELLEWHPTAGGHRPDADITVLMWIMSGDGLAEWESGWWNGQAWCLCESGGIVAGNVTHWAEPEGPAC